MSLSEVVELFTESEPGVVSKAVCASELIKLK